MLLAHRQHGTRTPQDICLGWAYDGHADCVRVLASRPARGSRR
jgi:hypothetical protein